jgi:hypothetical protein
MAEDDRPASPGWSRRATDVARKLPGFGTAERLADPLLGLVGSSEPEVVEVEEKDEAPKSAAERMNELLQTSMFQTPAESLEKLAGRIAELIVPDEARIVAALADGDAYPLIHVVAGGRSRSLRRVLANASSVGRAAGVALPAQTPAYLGHLFALGLIEEGPEDRALVDDYSILSTDETVRNALDAAVAAGLKTQRLVKRTVHLSPLGHRLWAVWRP